MTKPWKCECGFRRTDLGATRQRHASRHLTWWEGYPLGWDAIGDTVTVQSDEPFPRRRAAYELCRAYQREAGYDFEQMSRDRVVYLLTRFTMAIDPQFGNAISLIIWHIGIGWIGHTSREWHGDKVVCIDGLWTSAANRREGHTRRLIATIAAGWGVTVSEFAWSTPFSKSGAPLIRSMVPEDSIRLIQDSPR